MEKNTYPKIKDKIESMEKDSPSTFPRIFSTIAKSETKLGAWIYSNTRRTFLARPSNEISYRGWLISGLRTTFWHWVHARTHTQGIRRKIVPLSRTDYQEFPGTINLLAATPQAPFPPPPPLLFFRQPHSPSLQVKPPERDPSSLLSETVSQVVAPIRNHYHDRKRPRSSSVRGANCPRGRGCADCREEEGVFLLFHAFRGLKKS